MGTPDSTICIENYTYKRADDIKKVSRSQSVRTARSMFPDFSLSCLAEEFIIFICNEGKGILSICGREYKLESGSAACILPDDFFSFRSSALKTNSGDFFCSCTIIFIPYSSINPEIANILLISRLFVKDNIISKKSSHTDMTSIQHINDFASSAIFPEEYIKNTSENILIEIFNLSSKTKKYLSILTEEYKHLTNIAITIQNNFKTSDLSLTSLAKKTSYHPQHISKSFIKHFKKGIARYIKDTRLHYAASLSASSHLMIKEISKKCNIKSPSYLTKEFISKYKITPSEYRKKYK